MGTTTYYTDILFALEGLAWQKELLLPVSLILAELSRIKNESNFTNRPINSLNSIYKFWIPQTFAGIEQRNQSLATIIKKYPGQGFDLCIKLLSNLDRDTAFPTHHLRWRFFGEYKNVSIQTSEIISAINNAVSLLVGSCDKSTVQICKMIDVSIQLEIENLNRGKILGFISENYQSFTGNLTITDKIRDVIYHHQSFPDAKWSLPETEIKKYKHLMSLIEPEDIMDKYKWMFKDSYLKTPEIDIREYDPKNSIEKTLEIRGQALKEIKEAFGFKGICKFANEVKIPAIAGEAYAQIAKDEDFYKIFMAAKNETMVRDFAKSFFAQYSIMKGMEVFLSKIDSIKNKNDAFIYFPLSSIYAINATLLWKYVENLPATIQCKYWKNARRGNIKDIEEAQYLIKKFNGVNRFCDSIDVINYFLKEGTLSSELIINTIIQFMQSNKSINMHNISLELAHIIFYLDKRSDVSDESIMKIELLFYNLLKQVGDVSNIRLVHELLTNPASMMDLIKIVYVSAKEEDNKILEKNSNKFIEHKLGFDILWDFKGIPFVNEKYEIDEVSLNDYIDKLHALGVENNRVEIVDRTIGELLGNYPENDNYPPEAICRIIERLRNEDTNSGFSTRIYNKRGATLRPALSGGFLEKDESDKYKEYADSVRYNYPEIANIFDKLSQDYKNIAVRYDNNDKIERMEY